MASACFNAQGSLGNAEEESHGESESRKHSIVFKFPNRALEVKESMQFR